MKKKLKWKILKEFTNQQGKNVNDQQFIKSAKKVRKVVKEIV